MRHSPFFFLIDDDEDDRELFQIALADLTYQTELKCSDSGKAAIKLLKNKEIVPDFIFLDLNMPQMDGKECLHELKKDPLTADIPVVIYSTSSEKSDVQLTREMGAIGFITKPAKVEELTRRLNIFITEHYITEEEQEKQKK